jgi:hypothetical protein
MRGFLFLGRVPRMNQVIKKSVQIVRNNRVKDHAEKRYPHLYSEVLDHDKYSSSSWYNLSPEAYDEYKRFRRSVWWKRGVWNEADN